MNLGMYLMVYVCMRDSEGVLLISAEVCSVVHIIPSKWMVHILDWVPLLQKNPAGEPSRQ